MSDGRDAHLHDGRGDFIPAGERAEAAEITTQLRLVRLASRKTPCQPLDAKGRFHETDLKPKLVTKSQERFLRSGINGAATPRPTCSVVLACAPRN